MTEQTKREPQPLSLFSDDGPGPQQSQQASPDPLSMDELPLDQMPPVTWFLGPCGDEDRDPVCTVEFASHSHLLDERVRKISRKS